jgi:excisionase family DNA binding protein
MNIDQTADLFDEFKRLTDCAPSAAMLTLAHAILSKGQSDAPEYVSVRRAAELLNVGQDSVYDLCREGRLRHRRIGRTIRIRPRDLDAVRERN